MKDLKVERERMDVVSQVGGTRLARLYPAQMVATNHIVIETGCEVRDRLGAKELYSSTDAL